MQVSKIRFSRAYFKSLSISDNNVIPNTYVYSGLLIRRVDGKKQTSIPCWTEQENDVWHGGNSNFSLFPKLCIYFFSKHWKLQSISGKAD